MFGSGFWLFSPLAGAQFRSTSCGVYTAHKLEIRTELYRSVVGAGLPWATAWFLTSSCQEFPMCKGLSLTFLTLTLTVAPAFADQLTLSGCNSGPIIVSSGGA